MEELLLCRRVFPFPSTDSLHPKVHRNRQSFRFVALSSIPFFFDFFVYVSRDNFYVLNISFFGH